MKKCVLLFSIFCIFASVGIAQINTLSRPKDRVKYTLEKFSHYTTFNNTSFSTVDTIFTDYYTNIKSINKLTLADDAVKAAFKKAGEDRDNQLKLVLTSDLMIVWLNKIEPEITSQIITN